VNEDIVKKAILQDFKELLVKEFTTNWKAERFFIEMCLSVMSLDNTMKLIKKLEGNNDSKRDV
jgi:hypothetical protein